MPTVYAIDIRVKRKVRYLGVVHYAGSETLPEFATHEPLRPRPHGARCGTVFENTDETPAYLENAEHIVVTCIACASDRRR